MKRREFITLIGGAAVACAMTQPTREQHYQMLTYLTRGSRLAVLAHRGEPTIVTLCTSLRL